MKNELETIMGFCKENDICLCTKNINILEKVDLKDKDAVTKVLEIINNADSLMYSDKIMNYVRQNIGLEEWDTSRDEEIFNMPKDEVFSRVCNWSGLRNYGSTLKQWVEEIYKVKLTDGSDE